jgi:CBS domain-containing protein
VAGQDRTRLIDIGYRLRMARTTLDEAAGLTVADVTHSRVTVFGADATVGELREWFEEKEGHRLAVLADDGRYAGSLVPEDIDGAEPERPARELARSGPTVAPGEPAKRGEELALSTPARRVPVVDDGGRLLGIVAITPDLQGFCGTG